MNLHRHYRVHQYFALIALLISSLAHAAPDDVDAPKVQPQANRQFFMDDANLEANIFNPHGSAKLARARIESKLKLQLDELHVICGLADAQRSKLKLAASTDIKRFFDEVDVVRTKYRAGKQDQDAWQQIWQEISPLQTKLSSGLFGAKSFYTKSIRKTLSDEQFAKYDIVVRERRKYRYRACIEVVLTSLENTVPLRHQQHEAIVKLLVEETQPPLAFGQYDQHVIYLYLKRMPEDKLKPIFDEQQWGQLQTLIRNFGGMEQHLVQNGILEKKDADLPRPKTRIVRKVKYADVPADAGQPENRK